METKIKATKLALRRSVRERLQAMTPQQRAQASAQACALLRQQPTWREARTVLLYAPMPEELDVWPLVIEAAASGKSLALPRFDPAKKQYTACRVSDLATDIRAGSFGIREPGPHCSHRILKEADFILVPGLAFDLRGRRLGRGKGYYDQLLAQVRGITCAVAFDEQIVSEVPVEPHNILVNCLLTPTRWTTF